LVVSALLVHVASCSVDDSGDTHSTEGQPTANPQTEPTAEAEVQPIAKSAAMHRECMKQDDCAEGLVCVAHTIRDLRCEAYQPAPPRTGPEGRPVPPVGLLEGDALRAQMGIAP